MAKLAVIDNIISPGYQNYLEGLIGGTTFPWFYDCLLYTSDAADDLLCVDLGGRRII